MSDTKTYKEVLKDGLENHFFLEQYRSIVFTSIERGYNPEIIKEYAIVDLIPNGDKFIVKFEKRVIPLTNEQYQEKYWPEFINTSELKEWILKRIAEEKVKKEESLDVVDKASKGGKIKTFYDVLEYINTHED